MATDDRPETATHRRTGLMDSPSTKLTFGVLAAIIFVIALIGIINEYAEQRTRLRTHAAVAVEGDPRRGGYGVSAACLFATSLIGGALGALMSFSSSPWYADYAAMGMSGIGLDPVDDQRLAGLIMWIPGGLVHGLAAITLFYKWLKEADRAALSVH